MSDDAPDAGDGGGLAARVGAILAPLALVGLWAMPLPLEPRAHRLLAIVAAVVIAWTTEVLPIAATALLIGPLLVVLGVSDAKPAFAGYADPVLFLFYGSFFLAESMRRHGLDRRLAGGIVGAAWVRGDPTRLRVAMTLASLLLSSVISNSAATAILVPILLGALPPGQRGGEPAGVAGHLLAVAYGCSAGGMATLVGTPPNLVTARLLTEAGHPFDFLRWLVIGVPMSLVLGVAVLVAMGRLLPPTGALPAGGEAPAPAPGVATLPIPAATPAAATGAASSAWSRGEQVTLACFLLAVTGWLLPPCLIAVGAPLGRELERALPEGVVAMLAAAPLFLVRDEHRAPILPWRDALAIDWGLIMLFGGGIVLGTQMFETGLARELGRGFVQLTGVTGLWTFTAAAAAVSLLFTEFCSNTATAAMLIPLALGVAEELGVSPIPPALAVGFAASCGFVLPVATGPNAIVYGTGRVPLRTMLRAGFVLDVVCTVLIFAVLRLLCPLLGWD